MQDWNVEESSMERLVSRIARRPMLVLGGVVVLGMLEFVALQRSRRRLLRQQQPLPRPAAA